MDEEPKEERSFKFLFGYIKQYRKYFGQIVLGLLVGSLLQLILPFLTQSIVDVGIKNQNIGFIWLILLGQLMLTISRTAIDFIRRWLLLHISLRINISLVSDFFIKLLKLPMSFFDTKLMGDLMQRMGDHSRVNTFLTQQTLSIVFSLFTFVVFSTVLLSYNWLVFTIFMFGSLLYGGWLALFLRRRKVLDYELFEQQAINNNKNYTPIPSPPLLYDHKETKDYLIHKETPAYNSLSSKRFDRLHEQKPLLYESMLTIYLNHNLVHYALCSML
ncbi:Toxin RTX-I translocation ATP-binding protein [uncultured Prevotella sp.]|nr:Toxin RTX-I translocation ATP-binding protein [uncultured Prevotella sp.]